MKRIAQFIFVPIFILGTLGLTSCEKNKGSGLPVDGDGNEYDTVVIGTQTWFAENLRTTKYSDGRPIPLITDNAQWLQTILPAYCWYENLYGHIPYGAFYNWYAAICNICPTGWHVPTLEDWNTLIDYLGGSDVADAKLKESGTIHWLNPNSGATNESGFAALPGGERDRYGSYSQYGSKGVWWSKTPELNDNRYAWRVYINNGDASIYPTNFPKGAGFSVRCIKN